MPYLILILKQTSNKINQTTLQNTNMNKLKYAPKLEYIRTLTKPLNALTYMPANMPQS